MLCDFMITASGRPLPAHQCCCRFCSQCCRVRACILLVLPAFATINTFCRPYMLLIFCILYEYPMTSDVSQVFAGVNLLERRFENMSADNTPTLVPPTTTYIALISPPLPPKARTHARTRDRKAHWCTPLVRCLLLSIVYHGALIDITTAALVP